MVRRSHVTDNKYLPHFLGERIWRAGHITKTNQGGKNGL